MGNVLILAGIILTALNLLLLKKSNIANPFSLLSILFFLPLILSASKLSGLQSGEWADDTKILIGITVIIWGIYPYFYILKSSRKSSTSNVNRLLAQIKPTTEYVMLLSTLAFVILFIVENQILTGSLIPIVATGDVSHHAHTKSMPIINIVTRGASLFASFSYILFAKKKRKVLLFLTILVVLVPLTRGSRIDTFICIIALIVINAELKVIEFRQKKNIKWLIVMLVGVVVLMNIVGNERARFTQEYYSYSRNISLGIEGPYFEPFAWFYGYLSLPFENLNRVIEKNAGGETEGGFTLMPVTNTFINLSNHKLAPQMDTIRSYDDPITPNGVSSGLAYFYLDFGSIGASIPLAVYMAIWLLFYRYRNNRHIVMTISYAMYSSSFALAAFQPLMLNPALYRRLILLVVLIGIGEIMYLAAKNGRTFYKENN